MTAAHVLPDFGLPYAAGDFDERGRYHVVCPVCAERCYPEGGAGHETVEDDVTKGAVLTYGLHYERAAGEGR